MQRGHFYRPIGATRIVPSDWIEQSTHAYTENARDGAGYGYLWWINGFGIPEKNFYALGALGKFVIATMSAEEYNKLPTVPVSDMGHLLKLLLAAHQPIR